jgi:uracil-DNA glycosylase
LKERVVPRELLLGIARCAVVESATIDIGHPCHQVIGFQRAAFGDDHVWQPPTPWVGHLDMAPILFIGSNPSIGGHESYPTVDSSDEDLIEFFDNAFEGSQIQGGIRARMANGNWGRPVATWAGVRRRAEELLERRPQPGIDYALTEIVKCRSQRETGVSEARDTCADFYLERTIACSPAKVLVGLGAQVRLWLVNRWELSDGPVAMVEIGGRSRRVAFLPHPTARVPRSFAAVMPGHLPELRRALA